MGTTATVTDGNMEVTTAEQPEQNSALEVTSSANVTAKRLNYAVIWTTKKRKINGVETDVPALRSVTDEKSETEINDARKILAANPDNPKIKGALAYEQTVEYDAALTPEGMIETIPNDTERVKNHNDGMKSSRIGPRMKRKFEALTETTNADGTKEYTPTFLLSEQVAILNIREDIKDAATRTRKSKEAKILEAMRVFPGLKNASTDELKAFFDKVKNSGLLDGITASVDADDDEDEDEDEVEGEEVEVAVEATPEQSAI